MTSDRLDLSRLRIVEVGVALFRRSNARAPTHVLVSRVSRYCDPGCPIDAESRAIHGITGAAVRGQPTFAQRAPALARVLGGRGPTSPLTLVTYNGVGFDLPVLAAEFARAGVVLPPGHPLVDPARSLDVYDHVRHRYRGRRDRPASKKLGDQCAFFRVPLGKAHRAAEDACATGLLLLAMRAAGLA